MIRLATRCCRRTGQWRSAETKKRFTCRLLRHWGGVWWRPVSLAKSGIRTRILFYHQLTLRTHGVRRAGSAALDLCNVASGRFDGFWEFNLNPWDTAAGVLIVEEAGGKVTDFSGGEFEIASRETLAIEWAGARRALARVPADLGGPGVGGVAEPGCLHEGSKTLVERRHPRPGRLTA